MYGVFVLIADIHGNRWALEAVLEIWTGGASGMSPIWATACTAPSIRMAPPT